MHRSTPSLAAMFALYGVLAAGGSLASGTAHGQPRGVDAPRGFDTARGFDTPTSEQATSEQATSEQEPPSDADLKTFAKIYAELQEADTKFEHDMATARTAGEARAVANARDRASDAALSSHGWTRSKFDRVAAAIDRNPVLIERVMTLFEEDS